MTKKSKEGSFGFVYLWRDREYNRYYIGSHWGFEDDGYICSSNAMRDAYRRRKQDFKRRILQRVYTDRKDLLEIEQTWIDFIKPEEFGRRYYNKNAKVNGYYWWLNEVTKKEVVDKIKYTQSKIPGGWSHWKKGAKYSEETLRKMSESHKGKTWEDVHGKEKANELRKKHIKWLKTRSYKHSEEAKKKMSAAKVGYVPWNKGIKQKDYRKLDN